MEIPKEVYVKKLGKRGKIIIWQVNGDFVRSNLDEEFTNFANYCEFKFIPKNEFWIDSNVVRKEIKYFIANMLIQWEMMEKGVPFRQATDAANATEKAERMKSDEYINAANKDGKPSLNKVHIKKIGTAKPELEIYIIDGSLVRDYYKVNFVSGGHERVYDFVPKGEIWLDNSMSESEIPFVLLHELHERKNMGKGLTYNQAHRLASKIEWKSRQDEKLLLEKLNEFGVELKIEELEKK